MGRVCVQWGGEGVVASIHVHTLVEERSIFAILVCMC